MAVVRPAALVLSAFFSVSSMFSSSQAADSAKQTNRLECLATAIYFEARGEPEKGQRAVGQVVLNRVASENYPDSVCDVVYQNSERRNACQFSFTCDGKPDEITEKELYRDIRRLAADLLNCDPPCREDQNAESRLWTSTNYHATYVNPSWARKLIRTGQVGQHIFYRSKTA